MPLYNPNRRRKMLYAKENDEDSGKVSNDGGSFDASCGLVLGSGSHLA